MKKIVTIMAVEKLAVTTEDCMFLNTVFTLCISTSTEELPERIISNTKITQSLM